MVHFSGLALGEGGPLPLSLGTMAAEAWASPRLRFQEMYLCLELLAPAPWGGWVADAGCCGKKPVPAFLGHGVWSIGPVSAPCHSHAFGLLPRQPRLRVRRRLWAWPWGSELGRGSQMAGRGGLPVWCRWVRAVLWEGVWWGLRGLRPGSRMGLSGPGRQVAQLRLAWGEGRGLSDCLLGAPLPSWLPLPSPHRLRPVPGTTGDLMSLWLGPIGSPVLRGLG